MQIQLTITEEFGDVVSFAEFAQALQAFLAGRSHHVKIGKTETSPAAVAAITQAQRDALSERVAAEVVAAEIANEPVETPATDDKPKARRGRPPKAKTDEPVNEPSAPPAAEPDPFAEDVAKAETAIAAAPAVALTFDQIRPRVLKFMELRPDRAAAASEWSKAMKDHGYASVADITNDRVGEAPEAKAERVNKIVGVLEGMIATAEVAKAK